MYKFIKLPALDDKHDLTSIEVSLPNDVSISDMSGAFEAFLLACGYHPDNVNELFGEE